MKVHHFISTQFQSDKSQYYISRVANYANYAGFVEWKWRSEMFDSINIKSEVGTSTYVGLICKM